MHGTSFTALSLALGLGLGLGLVASLAACGSSSDSDESPAVVDAGPTPPSLGDVPDGSAVDLQNDLQLADVAILFPLPKNTADADSGYLHASTSGDRGVLLPQALDPAIGQTDIASAADDVRTGLTTADSYASLRVVAMRVDPCFASLTPDPTGATCLNQLRLIFQSVSADGTSFQDSAAHAFYSLTRAELVALTKSLVAARLAEAATTGEGTGPLAPNAIMAREGSNGAMSRGVRAAILHYAGTSNLTRVTHFAIAETGFDWRFGGSDISNAAASPPALTPMNIPTAASTMQEFEGFPTDNEINGTATPESTSPDDFMALVSGSRLQALTDSARQAAFAGLLHAEDPTKHSPNTIDCLSCHTATPTEKLVAPGFGLTAAGNANAFSAGSRFAASDLAPTVDPSQVNLHAFSYAVQQPGIAQRTVNEAAAVVNYLVANAK